VFQNFVVCSYEIERRPVRCPAYDENRLTSRTQPRRMKDVNRESGTENVIGVGCSDLVRPFALL